MRETSVIQIDEVALRPAEGLGQTTFRLDVDNEIVDITVMHQVKETVWETEAAAWRAAGDLFRVAGAEAIERHDALYKDHGVSPPARKA